MAEPAWVVRDVKRRLQQRVTISERWAWAERQGIPRPTMQGFLGGGQRVLRDRWELVSTPMDCYSV